MTNAALDSVAWFLWGLILILASMLMLTVAEFNAVHIFADSGVIDPITKGFAEWLAYMQAHSNQVLGFVRSFWSVLLIVVFATPLLAILILWGSPRAQLGIIMALLLGAALDLLFVLQYNGVNSGNGGYDGGEGFCLLLLHGSFGVLSVPTALMWPLRAWSVKTDEAMV